MRGKARLKKEKAKRQKI
ncbi:hypothetical protein CLS_38370 [[Clostridium] cf. saccharolyticum K10]|nr:hypothetical protein CLS_38370 [[Clostridium] cf. saccharolyticum K10]